MRKEGAIACFGECMVELRSPAPGLNVAPSADSRDFLWQQAFAGDTCNTAVYLSRLLGSRGPAVCWASAVGDDEFSVPMQNFWASENLDLSLLRQIAGGTTGLYTIGLEPNGERRFSYWRSASAARSYFDNTEPGQTPLERCVDHLCGLHFSAISLAILPPHQRTRLLDCARRVQAEGGWVSFDSNYRPKLWENPQSARYWMHEAMLICDRALISIDDWHALMGSIDDQKALADLEQYHHEELIIKRAGAATWLLSPYKNVREVPVQAIACPVDTTAAGDAFAAGYIAARECGQTSLRAVELGHALSRVVIMHQGAIIQSELMASISLDMQALSH